jgi:hypothetical protein
VVLETPATRPAGSRRQTAARQQTGSGINGQHVFVHVPAQTVVAKLSTWPTALSQDWRELTVNGVLAIANALQERRC